MTAQKPTALLAEDEPQMAEMVAFILESEGLDVVTVHDGLQARRVWAEGGIDIAVLDVGLPGLDGLQLCREIRAAGVLPVLLLTARSDDSEVIEGLEAGADDYVGKPFKPRVLALRVNALLRRSAPRAPEQLRVGDLSIDLLTRAVVVAGRSVVLTDSEWRLLNALAARPGEIVSWRRLLDEVWEVENWVGGRELVKAAIYRLRQRLHDDTAHPRYIETVRGAGYRLVP
ncbi:response regulator transcription factor [Pseudonocardia sp. TRM90224]|uniref:response regulator transcription factor n=1 Tax=Pseudonocardia sp. TRM90224 TaxID=2812678 RepID=UPI001E4AB52C|nr:response regulator transcription factor [Pseudonocardia sp. TRM90224]